jgi:hypothetical protein
MKCTWMHGGAAQPPERLDGSRSLRLFDRAGSVAAGTYLSLARLQMPKQCSRSRLLPRKAERNTDLGRGSEKL